MHTGQQMKIRMPAEMKIWLEREAARNLRSVTAEIVFSVRDRMEKALSDKTASEGGATPPKASPEA